MFYCVYCRQMMREVTKNVRVIREVRSKTQKKIDKGNSKKTQKRNQEVCTCVLKGTYVYYRYFLYICIYVLYAHTTLVANCIPFVD